MSKGVPPPPTIMIAPTWCPPNAIGLEYQSVSLTMPNFLLTFHVIPPVLGGQDMKNVPNVS